MLAGSDLTLCDAMTVRGLLVQEWALMGRSEKAVLGRCKGGRRALSAFRLPLSLGQTRATRMGKGRERRHVSMTVKGRTDSFQDFEH